jgi:hypothetical protein
MKKVVIFGAGYHGRAAFRKCVTNSKSYKVIGWVDNDPNKINKFLFKKKIYSPKNLNNLKFDLIIICGRNIDDQYLQISKNFKKKVQFWGRTKIKPNKIKIIKRELHTKKILIKVLKVLNQNKIKYWIDRSGLLSIIRDKNFSSLSDFDIAFSYNDLDKIFKIFKKSKTFHIFKGHVIRQNKKYKQIFLRSKNNELNFEPATIDFIFYKLSLKYGLQFDNRKKKIPINLLREFKTIKVQSIQVNIPKYYEEYLSYVYGKNYKNKPEFWSNSLKIKKKKYFFKKL